MDKPTATYTALGRLLAVVDTVLGLAPQAVGNCMTAPRSYLMGMHLTRALPLLARRPELNALVGEIMDSIELAALEALPPATPLVDQSTMQLAYWQQRTRLPGAPEQRNPHAGVDWSAVDWSKPNAQLHRELGVSASAVGAARKRHVPRA